MTATVRKIQDLKTIGGFEYSAISKMLGRCSNWAWRVVDKGRGNIRIEDAERILELHRKHCAPKPVNEYAGKILAIKSASGLSDLEICSKLGVTIGWLSEAKTSASFDPRASEVSKLDSLYQVWKVN
jgi:hypothetical protein